MSASTRTGYIRPRRERGAPVGVAARRGARAADVRGPGAGGVSPSIDHVGRETIVRPDPNATVHRHERREPADAVRLIGAGAAREHRRSRQSVERVQPTHGPLHSTPPHGTHPAVPVVAAKIAFMLPNAHVRAVGLRARRRPSA
jgi:hypothetical protein